MPNFDWIRVRRSKDLHRAHLVALPVEEKLRIVERLRDEGIALKGSAGFRPRGLIGHLDVVTLGAPTATAGGIHLNVLGANATLVTTYVENRNRTGGTTRLT